MPLVAGGAVAVGITLAIIVIVIVLMFRRYKKNGKFCNHLSSISDQKIIFIRLKCEKKLLF